MHRRAEQQPGITITGFVDNVGEYLARATVFIVPLLSGSGMRLKILQAMAMGKAIVSTTLGAEGITAVDGRDIILANSETEFAASVTRLIQDKPLRTAMGRNARDLVCNQYTWDHCVDLLEQAYSTVLHSKAANSRSGG
jgi:glycosyltransferase involved in cell wall biosynthesis